MHKWFSYKVFSVFIIVILVLSGFLLLYSGHSKGYGSHKEVKADINFSRIAGSEEGSSYIKYRTFQNADSTWGFTIFVNSKPYIHQKKIPLPSAVDGFRSEKDAEKVADLFSKMIKKGNSNPQLNKYTLDSLGI